MTSCAIGATEFFVSNDEEILQLAIEKDNNIKKAWTGHPKLKIVNNSSNFQEKIQKAYSHICAEIGENTDNNYFKKFLLKYDKSVKENLDEIFPATIDTHKFKMEECFLKANDGSISQIRLTKRGYDSFFRYTYSCRYLNELTQQRTEYAKQIDVNQYLEMQSLMIPGS